MLRHLEPPHRGSHLIRVPPSLLSNEISTNDTSPIYRKIDPTKLSFFDLPGEIREIIYRRCFALPQGRLTIHLVNDNLSEDKPREDDEYHVSSLRHGCMLDDDRYCDNSLDHLEVNPTCRRTSLLVVSRAVTQEATRYTDSFNNFRLIGYGRCDCECYHDDLNVIEQHVLTNIKRLEVGPEIASIDFDIDTGGWAQGTWSVVIARMVRLQCLTYTNSHAVAVHRFLEVFTVHQAIFLGRVPEIYVEKSDCIAHDYTAILQTAMRVPKETMSRFIIPPLQSIIFCGQIPQRHRNQLKTINFRARWLEELSISRGGKRLELIYGSVNNTQVHKLGLESDWSWS